jgi:hypothetical protein
VFHAFSFPSPRAFFSERSAARPYQLEPRGLPEFANKLPDKERDWDREKYRNGKNGRVAFGWLHSVSLLRLLFGTERGSSLPA